MNKAHFCFQVFLALVFGANADAAVVTGPFSQGMVDPVSFFVVDDQNSPDPREVVLAASSFNLLPGFEVQYLYAGVADWTTLNPATTFLTTAQGREQVTLRLFNAVTSEPDTNGVLFFQGFETPDLYTTFIVDWGAINLTISTASNDDNVAPVPLPGAVWLFGPGTVGLLGLRKKIKG